MVGGPARAANAVADALTRMWMALPRRDDVTPANGVPLHMTMADARDSFERSLNGSGRGMSLRKGDA